MNADVDTRQGEKSASGLLPYWKFHFDYLLHEDGSITGGLELKGLSLECRSDENLSQLRYQVVLFLHSLPPGVELQFLYQVRPFSPVLERFKRDTEEGAPERYRFIWRDSAAYLEKNSNIWHTRLYLFLTVPSEGRGESSHAQRIRNAFRSVSAQSVVQEGSQWLNQRQDRMYHAMEKLKSSVSLLGVNCRELTRSDIGRVLYDALNPARSQIVPYEKQFGSGIGSSSLYVREEVTLSGLQRFPREFILDDRIHRIMSIKDIPQRQYLGVMLPLFNIREFPFDITVGMEHQPCDEILKSLRKARNFNANLKDSGRADERAEQEYEVLQETIDRLVQGDEKAFRMSFQVHYWGRDEGELGYAEAVLRDAVHRCCESKEIREEFSYPWSFVGCLPGGFRKVKGRRALDTITQQALSLLPIYRQPTGAGRPVALLKTRTDELVGFDPFNPVLSASNAIIFGPTGRGKSFLAQYLLLQYFRLNPKVIIVDVGGSYRRITRLLGGDYIALSNSSGTALNPFVRLRGKPGAEMLGDLSGVVERMVKDEGQKHIDRITQHLIRQGIIALYEEGGLPLNFAGLRECFKRMSDKARDQQDADICRDLAKRLSLWIEGEGASLLVSEKTISLDSPVITIDLSGVPAAGDLQAVVMQILAGLIRHQVANVAGPKIILFDECWRHLADPTAAGVLDELYRTARKRFASVVSISQELEDFTDATVKTSIVKNSEVRFILQTIEELPLLEQVFRLNKNELDSIKSMTMQRGQYSEVFCMVGEEHGVLRVEATPWLYWMCTTHPPELEFEERLKEARPALDDLARIRWLAERYPQGIAAPDLAACIGDLQKEGTS